MPTVGNIIKGPSMRKAEHAIGKVEWGISSRTRPGSTASEDLGIPEIIKLITLSTTLERFLRK